MSHGKEDAVGATHKSRRAVGPGLWPNSGSGLWRMFGAMSETRTVEVPYGALCQAAGVLDGLTRALEHVARYGPGFSASAAQDAAP